jgi:hypothetical protein
MRRLIGGAVPECLTTSAKSHTQSQVRLACIPRFTHSGLSIRAAIVLQQTPAMAMVVVVVAVFEVMMANVGAVAAWVRLHVERLALLGLGNRKRKQHCR